MLASGSPPSRSRPHGRSWHRSKNRPRVTDGRTCLGDLKPVQHKTRDKLIDWLLIALFLLVFSRSEYELYSRRVGIEGEDRKGAANRSAYPLLILVDVTIRCTNFQNRNPKIPWNSMELRNYHHIISEFNSKNNYWSH